MNKNMLKALQDGYLNDTVLRYYIDEFKTTAAKYGLIVNRSLLDNAHEMPSDVKITFDNLRDFVCRTYYSKQPSFESRMTKKMHSQAYHDSLSRNFSRLAEEAVLINENEIAFVYNCKGCDIQIHVRKESQKVFVI